LFRAVLFSLAWAGQLPPDAVPAEPPFLPEVVAVLDQLHRDGAFPGAALVVGRGRDQLVELAVGRLTWSPEAPAATNSTLYDLASLTKVMATTAAVMLLVEDGRMDLDAPVRRYLPAFSGGGRDAVTVRHLLTHTSGLPAGASLGAGTAAEIRRRAIAVPLRHPAGSRVVYSDIGYVVLWEAASRASGRPLPELLQQRVFGPLGMGVRFRPGPGCAACAPSEVRSGGVVQGVAHDRLASQLGGVAGHAGLFGSASDVARFAAMMAAGGEIAGVRVFRAETVRQFTRRQPGAGTRALGWDTSNGSAAEGAAGVRMSASAYGHTGFTGTSLWIDPESGLWVVLLANRTYEPRGPNRMQSIRRAIHDAVVDGVVGRASIAGGRP
jgi:CubicO group peptidase (beta-lactamase class C family)